MGDEDAADGREPRGLAERQETQCKLLKAAAGTFHGHLYESMSVVYVIVICSTAGIMGFCTYCNNRH